MSDDGLIHSEADQDAALAAGVKNTVALGSPEMLAAAEQYWAEANGQVDHLVTLYREHLAECPNTDAPWCTDLRLDMHIEAAGPAVLQAALHRIITAPAIKFADPVCAPDLQSVRRHYATGRATASAHGAHESTARYFGWLSVERWLAWSIADDLRDGVIRPDDLNLWDKVQTRLGDLT